MFRERTADRARAHARNLRRKQRPAPLVERLEGRTLLAVDVWTGLGTTNNWSDAANWSLGVTPHAADTASFTSGAPRTTAVIDVNFGVASLAIDASWGGAVQAAANLNVSNGFALASGTFGGNGAVSIAGTGSTWTGGAIQVGTGGFTNNGTLTLTSAGPLDLQSGGTLTDAGTIVQSGAGSLRIDNGTTLSIPAAGAFQMASDAGITAGTGGGTVNNAGLITKTAGTGTSAITTRLNNTAGITAQTGTVSLHSSAGTNTGGTYTAASGATLDLTGGGDVYYAGTLNGAGAGTVLLGSGNLHVAGALTLNFPGTLFQWSGGTIQTAGQVVTNSAAMTLNAPAPLVFSGGGTLTNNGLMTLSGAGALAVSQASILNNSATGTIDFASDAGLANGYNSGIVNNAGLIEKTAGVGVSVITTQLNNSAAITVHTGTISLKASGGGNTGGVFTVSAGAVLDLTGGNTVRYSGTYSGSGAGAVSLATGTLGLSGDATFNFSAGLFQWSGGTLNLAGHTLTNAATGFLTLTSASAQDLSGGGTLTNYGTMTQTGAGGLRINDGIVLYNAGSAIYDFATDAGLANGANGGGTVTNDGIIEKTAGTGSSTILTVLVNSSHLTVQTGTVRLQTAGGTNVWGFFNVAAGATLDLTGGNTVRYSGTYYCSGAGVISLASGTLLAAGDITLHVNFNYPPGLFLWSGGTLNLAGHTLTNADDSYLILNSGSPVDLSGGGTLTNAGPMTQTGAGGLRINDGTVLNNLHNAGFNLYSDAGILNGSNGGGTVNNAGLLGKNAGSGTSLITTALNNSGVIEANSGTLTLATAGGTNTTGTYNANAGATLDLTGGNTVRYSGSLTGRGSGTVLIGSGTLQAAGPLTLNYPVALLNWSGGTIQTGGNTVTNTGILLFSSSSGSPLDLSGGGSLIDSGTIIQSGAGGLRLNDGATLNVTAAGTLKLTTDAGILNGSNGGGTVNNAGTIQKSAGAGTSAITTALNNSAKLTVQTGTLSLATAGGVNTGGGFAVAAGATLDLTGGNTVSYSGTYTGTGAGTVSLATGTLRAAADLSFALAAGLFKWSGGTLNLAGHTLTNAAGGSLSLTSAVPQDLSGGGTLTNAGTITQSGAGGLRINDGVTLSVAPTGAVNFATDAGLASGTGAGGVVNNAGLIQKTAGTGTSAITTAFNNAARLTVQHGTLQLRTAGGTSTGGSFTVAAGATLDLTGGNTVFYRGAYYGNILGTVSLASGALAMGPGGATFKMLGAGMTWTGGTIKTTPTAYFANIGTLALNGDAGGTVAGGGAIVNYGTMNLNGTGPLTFNDRSSLTVRIYAVLNINSDASLLSAGAGTGSLSNQGKVTKNAGTGTTTINASLNNTGTLVVASGTIDVTAASVAQFSNGTLNAGRWCALGNATVHSTLRLSGVGGITALGAHAVVWLNGQNAAFTNLAPLASNAGDLMVTGGATLPTPADFTNTGLLTLGTGGALAVAGNFAQTSAASLTIQFGGTSARPSLGKITAGPGKTVTLAGALNATLPVSTVPPVGTAFTILSNPGNAPIAGTFTNLPEGASLTLGTGANVETYQISYVGGAGNDVTLTRTA